MNSIVRFLLSRGFEEYGADLPYNKKLRKGNLRISINSSQSEISFNLTRKSGYAVSIVQLLSSCGLMSSSVSLIHEDYHILDPESFERVNEQQIVAVLGKNWPQVQAALLKAYSSG